LERLGWQQVANYLEDKTYRMVTGAPMPYLILAGTMPLLLDPFNDVW
jgi:hypothetical protein